MIDIEQCFLVAFDFVFVFSSGGLENGYDAIERNCALPLRTSNWVPMFRTVARSLGNSGEQTCRCNKGDPNFWCISGRPNVAVGVLAF